MDVHVQPLVVARVGQEMRVRTLRGANGHTQRLRELGLLEGKTIRVVCHQDPLICQLGDARFGLCRQLAQCVMVEAIPAPSA